MSTHPNYPAGTPTRLFEVGRTLRTAVCDCCQRDLEFDHDLKGWFVIATNALVGEKPFEAPGGYRFCSQRCLSQHTWNKANAEQRELLELLARMCDRWVLHTNVASPAWCLERSGISHLVDSTDLRLMDDRMYELAEKLLGKDYLNGKDDPPQWVIDLDQPKAPSAAEMLLSVSREEA